MANATINGCKIYYEIHGTGEPLLLLHGLGSSTLDWEFQVKHFANHYQVILCDIRGHGRSDKPPGPYSIGGFADDMAALLTHLEIPNTCIIGVSMGGMIALELALRAPERVRAMVIANSMPKVPLRFTSIIKRLLILNLFGLKGMGRYLSKQLFPGPDQEHLRNLLFERWQINELPAYKAATKAIIKWDARANLGEVKCPTLILSSDQDYWSVEEKQVYADQMPNATVSVLKNAHHLAPVECPGRFNQKVDEFLQAFQERIISNAGA